ncbi:hypothetical protein AVEN_112860-1 [Araneus ventricosus]|uniref:Uncharacterized protein n=1 Tax=Araneus ventricosus TaxID=182803 RepID=A0A4Y2HTR3_ARAVE|nr:hypothetical protein AVEN_112860-1 [Araneus ventricosus]
MNRSTTLHLGRSMHPPSQHLTSAVPSSLASLSLSLSLSVCRLRIVLAPSPCSDFGVCSLNYADKCARYGLKWGFARDGLFQLLTVGERRFFPRCWWGTFIIGRVLT